MSRLARCSSDSLAENKGRGVGARAAAAMLQIKNSVCKSASGFAALSQSNAANKVIGFACYWKRI